MTGLFNLVHFLLLLSTIQAQHGVLKYLRNSAERLHETPEKKYIVFGNATVEVRQNADNHKRLVFDVLSNYDKEFVLERPTVIHMDVLLLQVKNTVEKEGILESVIALMVEWQDKRIQWDPNAYSNITFLSLTTDQVWLPDIAMTNSAEHLYTISRDNRFTVRVSYDGIFKFVPTGIGYVLVYFNRLGAVTLGAVCRAYFDNHTLLFVQKAQLKRDLKLTTFPFDIQQCSLEFESWSLDSSTMTFDGKSDLVVDPSFASMQFQLCNYRATTFYHTYDFTGETFTRVQFHLMVKRKSTFYVINLIFPVMILSFIQTLTFLIPYSNTTADRIAFGTTNMLTLVVYQTILTEEMPKTSDAVTALSKYVITLIVAAAVGIIESVMVERLHGRTLRRPPYLVMRILQRVPVIMREISNRPPHNYRSNRCRRKSTIASLVFRPSLLSSDDKMKSTVSFNHVESHLENPSRKVISGDFPHPSPSPILARATMTKTTIQSSFAPSTLQSNGDYAPRQENSKGYYKCASETCPQLKAHQDSDNLDDNTLSSGAPKLLPLARRLESVISPEYRSRQPQSPKVMTKNRVRLVVDRDKLRQHQLRREKRQRPLVIDKPEEQHGYPDTDYYREWLLSEPSELWPELALKLDCLTFLVCLVSVVSAPIMMFLPLIIETNNQCNQIQL